ncbi:MAG: hypothetical protein A2167_03685 [Planctomycetes bacterium RBG_13_46_10]|nr:MAG: hypothetical protein A2167_03685 [Planctomycetes bacterium RBG_13_46_10]
MSKYNVNDAWPIDEPTNVEKCLKKLVKLSHSGNKIECHGATKLKYKGVSALRSKFDIRFFGNSNNKKKQSKKVEKDLLKSFVKKANPHFPPEARQIIDVARLKWDTLYNTGTVFVGRHFGLPTRCIDWTTDPLIALFFACRSDFKDPGVVWWMDYNVFSHALAMQWPLVYGKNENIEDDFEQDFTRDVNREILIRFHYWCFLERPIKQKAHIILSGQYDVRHDESIRRLGVQKCGRIVISSDIKSDLLDKLNRWGINSTALKIEDSPIDTIAADIADKMLGKNN